MNKKIELKKDSYVLFFINIFVFISTILFNVYFNKAGYFSLLIKLMLVLNVLLLLLGISLNIILIIKKSQLNVRRNIKITIIYFIVFLLVNTLGIYLINKPFDNKYVKITEKLSNYCISYKCDKYETVRNGKYRKFILNKKYYDYNNNENNIKITVKYSYKKILEITSVVYSENELFSENLIAEELNGFYSNFNYKIFSDRIKQAFDNRFIGKISYNNSIYKVNEIYKNKCLYKLKTIVITKFKN